MHQLILSYPDCADRPDRESSRHVVAVIEFVAKLFAAILAFVSDDDCACCIDDVSVVCE